MVAIVAAVGVDVVPVADTFSAKLAAKLLPQAAKLGDSFGKAMGQPISAGVTDGIDKGTTKANPAGKGAKAGEEYGGAFARTIRARIDAALKNLPDAKIDADSTAAERKLAAIRADMLSLRAAKIGVDLDAEEALRRIYELQARLEQLRSETPQINIDVDAGAALAEILLLRREVAKLDGRHRIDIDSSAVSGLQAGLQGVTGSLGLVSAESATSNLSIIALGSAGAALAPLIVPAATSAAAAVGLIAVAGVTAGAAIGVMVLAFSGIGNAVTALDNQAKSAGNSAANLANKQYAVASAADAIRTAERGLVDARIEGAEAVARAERNVADARQRVIDAQADVVTANARVADAEHDLVVAQRSSLDAQLDLTDARRDATRALEDLNDQVTDGLLDERAARVRVTQALLEYRKTLADRRASAADREEALISYQQAVQRYAELQRKNARLAQDKAEADRKGVEGSDQVVAAQKRIATSTDAITSAQARLAQAKAGALTSQRAVVRAQRDLADAVQNVADTQRHSSDRLLSAQQQLIAGQRQMQHALTDTGTAGSAAMNNVAAAMAKLSPAGRAFVGFLRGDFRKGLDQLKFAAQESFLPGLQRAFVIAKPLLPILVGLVKNVGTALGNMAIQAAKTFTQPFWKQFFTFLANTIGPNLEWMTRAGLAVAKMFAVLFQAFAPVGTKMGQQLAFLAEKVADFLASWVKSDSFTKFIKYMTDNAPLMAELVLSLLQVLVQFGIALAPLAPIIAKAIIAFSRFLVKLGPKGLLYVLLAVTTVLFAVAAAVGSVGLAIPLAIAMVVLLAAWWTRMWQDSETLRRVVLGTFHAIGAVFTWLHKNVVKPVVAAIGVALNWLNRNVVKPVFTAISWYISHLLAPWFTWLYVHIVRPTFGGIELAIRIFYTIAKMIFGLVAVAVIILSRPFLWLLRHVIIPVFKGMADYIAVAWTTRVKPVLSAIGGFIGKYVVPVFKTGVKALGKAWDGIIGVAKKPVQFVVQTVLNNGIIRGYNSLVGMFDKRLKVGKIPWPPRGWSKGGVVPGYEPGVDRHPAMLSGGEGILVPQATRQIGAPLIEAWNAAARSGKRIQGFAKGGLVGSGPGTFLFMQQWLKSRFPAARASTYQPSFGYHRADPKKSYASDIFAPNMVAVALAIRKAFKPQIKELIHTPLGKQQVWNGRDYQFTGAALRAAHMGHVHWSMLANGVGGGIIDFLGDLVKKITSPVTSGVKKINEMLGGATPYAKAVAAVPKKAIRAVVNKGSSLLKSAFGAFFLGGDNLSNTASSPAAHTAQQYARSQFGKYGWGIGQVQPLVSLWNGESNWNVHARNGASGAYGIPQALPGSKMASAGRDWHDNFRTQVDWGLQYIKSRYGAPSNAFAQWTQRSPHWYDDGGYLPQGLSTAMNGTGQRERVLNPAQTRAWEHGRDGSMTLRVVVDDGKVAGLVRVEIDEALGSLADAHVYAGVS